MLELLAPAGSMESLRAAVQNGADAVYLGVGEFNARQSAKNFTLETLSEALKYCHIRGVQVHLTLNTLVADKEMQQLRNLIRAAASAGVDAFIVQDWGVVQLCRQIAPHVPVHGSTQMTVHNLAGVQMCAAMGIQRVVLSRELNREEIGYICAHSPIEIEIFGHGALCMCYSGQCYLSAMIGGRSGNRGRCAQPCRQSYGYSRWENKYPLSLKDNCLIHYTAAIEEMGVASLKLEGRMKRPEYVAAVTRVYRSAIDGAQVTQEMIDTLYKAFNRQGFTNGYYLGKVTPRMFGIHEDEPEDTQFLQTVRQSYEGVEMPLVDLKFKASVTVDGSSLSAEDADGHMAVAQGPRPERAMNVALSQQMLAARVAKTGGTPFRCASVQAYVDPGLMLSAAAINGMRRDVLNQMTALRARREEHPVKKARDIPYFKGPTGLPGLTVQIAAREQLTKALLDSEVSMLYIPLHILAADARLCQSLANRGRVGVVLPRIVHDGEVPKLKNRLETVRSLGIRDALVGNIGLMLVAKECGMRLHGDFGMNLFNSASANVMRDLKLASATVSIEMTLPQIRDLSKAVNMEMIAYGRLPLMITEQCLIKNKTGECGCQGGPAVKLTDKTGADFPVMKEADSCRSVLLNGKKLYWLDRQNDLSKLGLWAIRLNFTTENAREVDRILEEYLTPTSFDPGACTRGLYLRGVE